MRLLPIIVSSSLLALGLAGCGGGGGASTNGNGSVNTFITDSLSNNDQVWSRIHEIELVGATGSVKIFEDTEGQTVNLRALRDATGARFSLMSVKSIPVGTYTGAVVKMAKSLTIVPTGSSTGALKSFDDSLDDSSAGKSRVTLTFTSPLVVSSGSSDVILDFDLANWTDTAGKIMPVIRKVDDSTVSNPLRHEGLRYRGTTSNLAGTAPNRTFTLTTRSGETLLVQLSATTRIFNDNALPNPALTNSQRLDVLGVFDKSISAIRAAAVKIHLGEDSPGLTPEIHGIASDVSDIAGTFKITVGRAENYLPNSKIVNVTTSSGTIYRSNSGAVISKEAFFDDLATGGGVEAEGSYDNATMTLNATKVKLDDEPGTNPEAEAKGIPSNPNPATGSFSLSLQEWEGFSSSLGASVSIRVAQTATFEDQMGETLSRTDFFNAIANGLRTKVKGRFAEGVLTATRCELRN
jgi:hypothetical protein